jgi:hypothetical protein
VWVDGEEVFADLNGSFSTAVLISLGTNTVTIVSRDAAGNEGQASVVVVGADPYASLTSQLQQLSAQVNATQQQLSAAQAAQAAAASQVAEANARLNTTQAQFNTMNGSLTAARQEADAQRGLALGGMVLAAIGVAAGVAAAFMMRRRPGSPFEAAQSAPASAAPVTAQVPPSSGPSAAPPPGNAPGTPPPSN